MDLYINVEVMAMEDVMSIISTSNVNTYLIRNGQIHVQSDHHLWLVRLLNKLTGWSRQHFNSPTVIVV